MVITLGSDLESALAAAANRQGISPDALAISVLRQRFLPIEPRDEWERQLLSIGRDCGVSLTNEQLSRDAIYDDDY